MALVRPKPILEVKAFLGIHNQEDATRLIPAGGKAFQASASNVDIDDAGIPHRRKGYAAASYTGTAIHSLWGNGTLCLFVEGNDLKFLNKDYTAGVLAQVGAGRMAYVDAIGKVFYTNGARIGFVRGELPTPLAFIFPPPTMTYRIPMPAGQLIEYFNGRLYVARGKVIHYSDPLYPWQTHEQKGFFQFPGDITLLRSIRETGVLVSDGIRTYLMAGLDAPAMKLTQLADYPAILGSDVKLDGSKVGGIDGEAVYWLSSQGVCMAGRGGLFKNLTREYYWPKSTAEASAILRLTNGFYQYLVTQAS